MRKAQFEYFEKLLIAQNALLVSIIEEMDSKGMIDGSEIMKRYCNGFDYLKKELDGNE